MNERKDEIFKMASGDISVWVDDGGAICLKLNTEFNDPVELGEREALELGNLLLRLVKEQREY